jgi:DNA-binding PadR family transcriptional regulator
MAKRDIRLTPTSYIVLGLIDAAGRATPYDLKRVHQQGIGGFWELNHAQIYAEPDRLVAGGFLSVEQEEGGRRRKVYELTDAGRAAFSDWLASPTEEFTELRDPGLLQLFFGASPGPLAEAQRRIHADRLAEYERLRDSDARHWPPGPRLVLDSGIGHEREWLRFWDGVADEKKQQ